MKKLLLSFSLFIVALSMNAQTTATNFNCNDCASMNHDLFTELNSGKVVVITWVMPCSACIAGATAAQNAVNSFSASNPGKVVHYIADDVANTSCATLGSWCTTNALNPAAKFSNTAVSMSNYGASGMPKVVVLGATTHSVYYNVNNSAVNQGNITTAINNALAATATGINESAAINFGTKLSPNPANNELTLTINSDQTEKISIEITNMLGQKVMSVENTGTPEIKINTENLSNGSYFLKINDGKKSDTVKFIVAH